METTIWCAYNLSRKSHLSPKVTVVDKPDQPLTLMRLLVESLGFKAQTALWLTPLHAAPQLVRPFPFDLVYLDAKLRVITAVELLPEVPFPTFHEMVASALILPVRTITQIGIETGDELMICGKEELDTRLAEVSAPAVSAIASVAAVVTDAAKVSSTAVSNSQLGPALEVASTRVDAGATPLLSTPPPSFTNEPAFVAVRTGALAQTSGYTLGITTAWQVANSTFEAVLPATGSELQPEPSETDSAVVESAQDVGSPENKGSDATAEPDAAPQREQQVNQLPGEADRAPAPQQTPAVPVVAPPNQPKGQQTTTPSVETAQIPATAALAAPLTPETAPARTTKAAVRAENTVASKQSAPISSDARPKTPPRPARAATQDSQVAKPPAPKTAEEAPRKQAPAAASGTSAAETAKTSNRKRKSFGFLVKEFLNCPDPLPENRLSARLVQQGMVAYDKPGDKAAAMQVRDVSPSGFYLRTKNRWRPGYGIALTLERSGARDDEFQSRVDVQATVVRCDDEGVGLKWVFPEGVKFEPWERLHTKRTDESDLQYFLRELRLAKAQGFLQRVSPLAKTEIRHALHDRLSNKRVAGAVEIALQAEKTLTLKGVSRKALAHPDVVMRIIESGSWIEDNWIRTMWGGLLVSSCTADGQDTSNLTFIDLLARQTPVHLRLLSFVCKKVEEAVAEGASPKSVEVLCTAQELTDAADSHSFARIQQTIGQLATSGLIVESARPSYASVMDKEKTRATPTLLGLRMHARCNGHIPEI